MFFIRFQPRLPPPKFPCVTIFYRKSPGSFQPMHLRKNRSNFPIKSHTRHHANLLVFDLSVLWRFMSNLSQVFCFTFSYKTANLIDYVWHDNHIWFLMYVCNKRSQYSEELNNIHHSKWFKFVQCKWFFCPLIYVMTTIWCRFFLFQNIRTFWINDRIKLPRNATTTLRAIK